MKKLFMLFCISTTILLSLYSCGSDPSFPADQVQKMNDAVNLAMSKYNFPGVIAGVWVPNKGTWVKAFGYANTATGQAMDPNMTFRIASVSKTFTVTVILRLVDEGKLSLDDTLDKYITDPAVPNAGIITIRQIANMTSGVFDYTSDAGFIAAQQQDPLRVWTPKELVNFALTHNPSFDPGAKYEYSNTNYILLGMIIEKITGNSIDSEIQNRIVSLLHLSNTAFATTSAMPSNSSHGYSLDTDGTTIVDITAIDPSVAWAAGGVISNIYDLKTWVEALSKGTLISASSHTAQLTWVDDPASLISKYGLGIMKVGNFIGHSGSIYGFNNYTMYLPSNGAVIIVMVNLDPAASGGGAASIFAALAKIVLPNDVSW